MAAAAEDCTELLARTIAKSIPNACRSADAFGMLFTKREPQARMSRRTTFWSRPGPTPMYDMWVPANSSSRRT